jgi:hypothetical protein
MKRKHLKILIETGDYRPEPARVAQAMLRRRGVRELLTDGSWAINPVAAAGRIPPVSARPRRAA